MVSVHRIQNNLNKPQGRLLVIDVAFPTHPLSRGIAKALLGSMLDHDLHELRPEMEAAGFSEIEIAQAKYRVMGLSILSYVRGRAHKS
jgi:hypothetical protein